MAHIYNTYIIPQFEQNIKGLFAKRLKKMEMEKIFFCNLNYS